MASENKILDLSRLFARLLGLALYVCQAGLALLIILGVGSTQSGLLSIDTVVDQAIALTKFNFEQDSIFLINSLFVLIADAVFVIMYICMLVGVITNVINGLSSLKKASLGASRSETWTGVGELKNSFGKNVARILLFSVFSSMWVDAPMAQNALIGIWGGLAIWVIVYVSKIFFENDKAPRLVYLLAEVVKLALRAFLLLSCIALFKGKYIAEMVESISLLLNATVVVEVPLSSPWFLNEAYNFVVSLFTFAFAATWLCLIRMYLMGKNQSANKEWKALLSSVIVLIVLDFIMKAFVLNAFGDIAFTQKCVAWFESDTLMTYLPLICLAVAGTLLAQFPPIKKYSDIIKKTETKKATIIPVKGNKNGAKSASKTADDAADELLKYKEMLDEGIITESDYEKKKKQILGL